MIKDNVKGMFDFSNKAVVITGATGELGKALS